MSRLLLIPISLFAILLSPFVLWNGASQSRADDFESAREVEISEETEDGYLLIEGTAEAQQTLSCPPIEQLTDEPACLYVSTAVETYTRSTREACTSGEVPGNILETRPDSCDEEGNCTPCYLVEEFNWKNTDSSTENVPFTIGNYTIPSFRSANILGQQEFVTFIENSDTTENQENQSRNDLDDIAAFYGQEEGVTTTQSQDPYYELFENSESDTQDNNNEQNENDRLRNELLREEFTAEEGDIRVTHRVITDGSDIVVAGNARNGEVSEDDKEFVISAQSYAETLDILESQDSSSANLLRILSFMMMVGGFMTLFGTIASIPLLITKLIPWIGDDINRIISSGVTFIAAVIGGILWGIFFVLISIVKSPIFIVIIVGIVGYIGWRIWQKYSENKTEVKAALEKK